MRLKWLVVLTIAGIQLAAAALVVVATWQAVSDGVGADARESMHRVGRAARDRLQHFIAPAENSSRLLQRLLMDGTLNLGAPEPLERFLFEVLRLHPAFDAVYFGLSTGEFLYVGREPERPGFLVKEIRGAGGERRVTFRRRGDDYQVDETWEDPDDTYDPRVRPWFSAAVEAEATNWTAPYVFFTSRRPGVSTANAMLSTDGEGWGGVAVDIELATFSAFLTDLSGGNEVAFIVDRDGHVVALPERPERWSTLFEPDPLSGTPSVAGDSFQKLVADAVAHGRRFGEIDVAGRSYLIDLQAIDRVSLPWLMVVAVPSDTLYGWVHDLRDRVVATTVGVAATVILLMLFAWRFGVERPIALVSARLRRIAEGELDPRSVLGGPAEFRELDASAAETGRKIEERERAYRNLVRTLREYEHAVRQSPAGIAILERDGRVVFANEAYRRIFGPADPLGEFPRLFADTDGIAPVSMRMETVRAGRSAREDLTAQRADDGSAAVFQCVLAPLFPDDGSEGQALLLVEDVTGRKRVEEGLVDARNAAERSDRAKTAFLGQMSHELRTPLNAIIGFSEVMRAELFGPMGSPRYAQYVEHIETSAKHLKDLIDRVLDLSRVEQGALRVTFQEIDPVVPVREAVDMVRPAADDAGVTLTLGVGDTLPPPSISADPSAVRQIVVNLVANSVKFSPSGSTVATTLGGTTDGGAEITVADQGIGIDPQDLPHVFEPFWQGGSTWEAGRVGVGLGLAIVRTLVDRHGGRIDIDSRPGAGTRVRVRLPADPTEMPALPD